MSNSHESRVNLRGFRSVLLLMVLAMACGVPFLAAAQEEESSPSDTKMEEIVVTATKRAENVNEVPLSIQALSGSFLKRLTAQNFADYARTLAGVSFIDQGPGRDQIFIRGVSTGGDSDTGKESTVAIYYDEVPVTEGSSQPDLKLFDIERVEVLRGPQGTLYGSGAMGGAIRVITKKPNFDKAEGYVEAQGSVMEKGDPNGLLDAALNIPMSDMLALRVVGYGSWNGGFLDNGFSGKKDINSDHTYGGRAALRFQPTSNLDINLKAIHQKTHSKVWLQETDHFPHLIIDESAPEPFDDRFDILNAEINYDFNFATLTSSTSYLNRRRDFSNDIDWFTEAYFGFPRADSDLSYKVKSYSEEVRLVSSGDTSFTWLIGGFFLKRPETYLQVINPADAMPATQSDNFYFGQTDAEVHQYAGFGEVGYEIVPRLTLTAGVRVSRVKRSVLAVKDGAIFGALIEQQGVQKETPVTPKFNISYKFESGSLIYAQASKGFRIGGVNPGLPPCPSCIVQLTDTFDSDSLWNYELGVKMELLEAALTTNLAVFYIDWSNIQLNVSREDGFNGFLNAGNARSKGIEWTFDGQVNRHLGVGGQVTYTDAKLKSLAEGVTGVGAVGDRLPSTAKWMASGYAEVGTGAFTDGRIYFRGDLQYVGDRNNSFESRSSNVKLDNYALINLKAGLEKGPYELSLFVKNLTDKRAKLSYEGFAGVHDGEPITYNRYAVNRPRTIGLTVSRSF